MEVEVLFRLYVEDNKGNQKQQLKRVICDFRQQWPTGTFEKFQEPKVPYNQVFLILFLC